jgi:predicted DNA-binding antitoxin AbrB/MazE fold protein
MSERIDAIFENGVFRPEVPVNILNGQRVSLDVEKKSDTTDDLADVSDLLDVQYVDACRQNSHVAPSLADVQQRLSAFAGSLSDRIVEERNER